MINPNRTHRARGLVVAIRPSRFDSSYTVTVEIKGQRFEGWIDNSLEVGDSVNIQAQYSICLNRYVIKTARKTRSAA